MSSGEGDGSGQNAEVAEDDDLTPIISIEAIPGRPSEPRPALRLGNYEIVQSIGSGGMAEVFLARNVGPMGFEKVVVLKCIHPHLAKEKQFVDMFLDEARLAARVNDPRVVQIYELGEANGTYFMAMEYLAGESVSSIVKTALRGGPVLPVGLAARVIADTAAGLHAAHELRDSKGRLLDVVHRDVSHDNIVVLYSGAVKVLDFGVAKARDSLQTTSAGERKGKFGYMSPEQIMGEPLDRRSDVFSLGVVLWELLTRQRLFSAETELETVKRVMEGVPPAPSTVDKRVPAELDAIVAKALAKDRRQRYQTAEDLCTALEDWMRAANISSGMTDLAQFMRAAFKERIEQRARLLKVGQTGEEPPLAAISRSSKQTVISGDQAKDELDRLRSRTRVQWLLVALGVCIVVAGAYHLGRRRGGDGEAAAAKLAEKPPPAAAPRLVTEPPIDSVEMMSLADSLFERAEIAIRNGRIASPPGDNALEFLLDAEKADPKDERGKTLRAQAVRELLAAADELWTAGKLDSARSVYADVLLFEPENKLATERAKKPVKAGESPKAPTAEEVPWLVTQIDLAIIERRLTAPPGHNALEYLQQLRQLDPNNEVVRRLGGEIAGALKTEAGKAKPDDAKKLLAAAKVASGDAAEAPATVPEKARDPAKAKELVTQGNSQLASGHLAEARNAFEHAITADSGSHAALAGLSEVAYNESDYTRAVLAAKRAIALSPSSTQYRMLLAKSYYKLLRYDDAIKQWQKVLELDPKNTAAQKDIEMAQRRMGH